MDPRQAPNLVSMFFTQADRLGDKPFLWAKQDGAWHPITWRQAADQVRRLAHGLKGLGIAPGDRVVLVSENRPEWLIADVAIMAAGAVTVPAYVTNTIDNHLHILDNSEARAAIVSTRKLAKVFLPAAHRADTLKTVITIEDADLNQHLSVDVMPWSALIDQPPPDDAEVAALARTDTACIIYTSGTGGAPKGVMTSHGAILHNCAGAQHALHQLGLGNEVFLSFLPLSHSYEHTAGQFFPISIGAQIYYAEGVEHLGSNMAEVHPTIMTAVPRLYEMMHGRITKGIQKTGGKAEKLFNKAVELGSRRYHDPKSLNLADRIADFFLERLVRNKVRSRFGGRLKALVSGGAPLNPDIGLFFTALGMRILQGYGLTESAPVISVNLPDKVKLHTVGPLLPDTELKIAEDGEILVKGELVMQGYWRNDSATREAIKDGWLHTGDVGVIDGDGYIQITDRKKDLIVNSGGDNISPQRVEGILTLEPEIAQAMVYGDKRPHLVAAIVPDADWVKSWAAEWARNTDDLADLASDPDLQAAIGKAVARVNAQLSTIEKVRRFILAPEAFTIDNGMMTPTMKIRRHIIRDKYGKDLESLYG